MRKWLIPIAAILLLAACRHGDKGKPQEQDISPTPPPQTETADTTCPPAPSTTEPEQDTKEYTLEQEKEEVRNLRIFARKQRKIYDASLLVGEWIRGTEHEVYLANGTGLMWDTSEDISRDEAQRFEWTLDSNLLTIVCRLELGGVLPKRYVVTYADDESLAYSDHLGSAYLWDKKE